MIIRNLELNEYQEAIEIKYNCWDEELAGRAPNRMNKKQQLEFVLDWITTAKEHNDIRLIYGAFSNNKLLGWIGASIAEIDEGVPDAIEINYLFVNKEYRGNGISLKLIKKILDEFSKLGYKNVLVYNHHYAPSNNYYRKLGGKVIRQDIQDRPTVNLEVDIFCFSLLDLHERLESMISSRYQN